MAPDPQNDRYATVVLFFFSGLSATFFAAPFRNCFFAAGGQFFVVLSHASLSRLGFPKGGGTKLPDVIVACGANSLER